MRTLDLVLINPSSRTRVYQSLGTKLAAVENPVWAGLMATYCRRLGYSVEIIDAEADELVPAEVADRVADMRPRLAAVVVYGHQPSASTQIMTASEMVCAAIKEQSPEQPLLLIGGHVAALVNPPGNPKSFHWLGDELPADADAWQEATPKRPGSWWESWTAWCAERSGPRVPAPEALGSADYPAVADAPGDYVRESSHRT